MPIRYKNNSRRAAPIPGRAWREAGGAKNAANPADPYMTLVGYFNSLRELGGSRRIVEDEVASRLLAYADRRRVVTARSVRRLPGF